MEKALRHKKGKGLKNFLGFLSTEIKQWNTTKYIYETYHVLKVDIFM